MSTLPLLAIPTTFPPPCVICACDAHAGVPVADAACGAVRTMTMQEGTHA